jgi:uncharacterized caspase-like protein
MGTLMTRRALGLLAVVAAGLIFTWSQAAAQSRIAFVVGNGAYAKGAIDTALNDAGLVAEALRTAGFEIVEGADLDQSDLRRLFREFLGKVEAAGPEAIAFVYFAGYGLEFDGENYLVPVDAQLGRVSDIPIDAVRLSDLTRPLAGAAAQAKIVVVDAARALPFAFEGDGLAPGLAAVEATPGLLVAFSSAPATVAEGPRESYGPYASALAEMIQEPGIDIDTMFTGVRSRTHQLTEGKQTPWHVNGMDAPVVLLDAEQPTDAASEPPVTKREVRPMRDLDPEEAYALAIELDTLEAYAEFVEAHPRHALAPRIWAILRARREALAWQSAVELDTPEAYWTYLQRYPDGIYAADARRRLRRLAAAFEPPPDFAPVAFTDVPLPLPDEPPTYVVVYSVYAPPPPIILIKRPRRIIVRLPPLVRIRPGVLPRPRNDWPRHRQAHPRGPDRPIRSPNGRPPVAVVPGQPRPVKVLPAPRDLPRVPRQPDRPIGADTRTAPGPGVRPALPPAGRRGTGVATPGVMHPTDPPMVGRPSRPPAAQPPAGNRRLPPGPPPAVGAPVRPQPPVRVTPPPAARIAPPVVNRPAPVVRSAPVTRPVPAAPAIQRQAPAARSAAPEQRCRGRGCG